MKRFSLKSCHRCQRGGKCFMLVGNAFCFWQTLLWRSQFLEDITRNHTDVLKSKYSPINFFNWYHLYTIADLQFKEKPLNKYLMNKYLIKSQPVLTAIYLDFLFRGFSTTQIVLDKGLCSDHGISVMFDFVNNMQKLC